MKSREEFRIVFMGTPAFAVRTLETLYTAGYPVPMVVTTADKPAGRGLRPRPSPVKQFAEQNYLPLMQPVSLKEEGFIGSLANLNADLFVVVAFRMLPQAVWSLPAKGTINLHASLLPDYRGAAPINRAIINGENITGVTTFLIDHEIDTGELLMQEEVSIGSDETAGELHDRLMETGASLVLKTVDNLREHKINPIKQSQLINEGQKLNLASKLSKEDCRINWIKDATTIHNLIRGLSPYPAAYTTLLSPEGIEYQMKIFRATLSAIQIRSEAGEVLTDASRIFIATSDGVIELLEVQLAGKSRMHVKDFLNGFRITPGWKVR